MIPFFIVGVGRCGTKMLRKMLCLHPKIRILPETHFVPTLYDKFGMSEFGFDQFFNVIDSFYSANNDKWLKVILNSTSKKYDKFYKEFKVYSKNNLVDFTIKGHYKNFCDYLYGKNVIIGDKTPHYGTEICLIKKIWPKAKIINLTRNGIDSAVSMLKHPGFVKQINGKVSPKKLDRVLYNGEINKFSDNKLSIYEALDFWAKVVRVINGEIKKLKEDDAITIKYEQTLFYPRNEIEKIFNFLDIGISKEIINQTAKIPSLFPVRRKIGKVSEKEYLEYYSFIKKEMNNNGYFEKDQYKRNLLYYKNQLKRLLYFNSIK